MRAQAGPPPPRGPGPKFQTWLTYPLGGTVIPIHREISVVSGKVFDKMVGKKTKTFGA